MLGAGGGGRAAARTRCAGREAWAGRLGGLVGQRAAGARVHAGARRQCARVSFNLRGPACAASQAPPSRPHLGHHPVQPHPHAPAMPRAVRPAGAWRLAARARATNSASTKGRPSTPVMRRPCCLPAYPYDKRTGSQEVYTWNCYSEATETTSVPSPRRPCRRCLEAQHPILNCRPPHRPCRRQPPAARQTSGEEPPPPSLGRLQARLSVPAVCRLQQRAQCLNLSARRWEAL